MKQYMTRGRVAAIESADGFRAKDGQPYRKTLLKVQDDKDENPLAFAFRGQAGDALRAGTLCKVGDTVDVTFGVRCTPWRDKTLTDLVGTSVRRVMDAEESGQGREQLRLV